MQGFPGNKPLHYIPLVPESKGTKFLMSTGVTDILNEIYATASSVLLQESD
jgi:hypothetical protein